MVKHFESYDAAVAYFLSFGWKSKSPYKWTSRDKTRKAEILESDGSRVAVFIEDKQ